MPIQKTDTTTLLSLHSASSLAIHSHGATITSWKSRSLERLYLSPLAVLDGSRAIRGGIPIVFPQFGPDPSSLLPQHGFARNDAWTVVAESESAEHVSVTYSLASTASAWPRAFKLECTVVLRDASITQELRVENCDTAAWSCSPLLQYYILL